MKYGNVVWYPHLQTEIDLIESVQHRAIRMVPGFHKISYEQRLQKMELPTLEYRRVHGDVIEAYAYKYLQGLYNVDPSDIL